MRFDKIFTFFFYSFSFYFGKDWKQFIFFSKFRIIENTYLNKPDTVNVQKNVRMNCSWDFFIISFE